MAGARADELLEGERLAGNQVNIDAPACQTGASLYDESFAANPRGLEHKVSRGRACPTRLKLELGEVCLVFEPCVANRPEICVHHKGSLKFSSYKTLAQVSKC